MKVVVCVKQTPSTTAVFSVENGGVNWEDPGGKPNVVNPWDEYAVEEAIRLQENHGGDAIALTVGNEEKIGTTHGPIPPGATVEIYRETDTEVRTSLRLQVDGKRCYFELGKLYAPKGPESRTIDPD